MKKFIFYAIVCSAASFMCNPVEAAKPKVIPTITHSEAQRAAASKKLAKMGIQAERYIEELFYAIMKSDVNLCKLIVSTGVNVNRVVSRDVVVKKYESELIDFNGHGRGAFLLHYAAKKGNAEIVKILLQAGASPNVGIHYEHDSHMTGPLPLNVAVQENHVDCVKILLSAGSRVDYGDCGAPYAFPLYEAISNGNCEMVRILASAAADNYYYHVAGTPLWSALSKNKMECA
ncbi:MAG: ankyrin repeat domain-containing protein, partial [Akkermansia sp.]|nr:ankyrin repeat domain-containing protein [Akkermansia sp.]